MIALYFAISAVGLIAAAFCYRANAPYRGLIENTLEFGTKLPERVYPIYGARYLNKFIRETENKSLPSGNSVLNFYIRPVLLWIDIGFAIFCSAFAAFFWLGALEMAEGRVWPMEILRFCLTMSVLYGVADVAEDLWLVRLFSMKRPVNCLEGLIACVLTQVKLVAIFLSGVGGLYFQVLSWIFPKPAATPR